MLFAPVLPESLPLAFRCEPAFEYRALACDRPNSWNLPGTGGVSAALFWTTEVGVGYRQSIVRSYVEPDNVTSQLMKRVKAGFGRTFAHLPAVFGVSRQTLYNWASGDVAPRAEYKDRLRQLAAAADVFGQSGIRLTASSLDRPLLDGKSFLVLLGEGQDGSALAQKLVRMERRGVDRSSQVDALLAGQPDIEGITAADYGAPALNEEL